MKLRMALLAMLTGLVLTTTLAADEGDDNGQHVAPAGLRVPINAGAVTGSFNIVKFAAINGKLNAIGTINVTDGTRVVVSTIAWPVATSQSPASSLSSISYSAAADSVAITAAAPAAASCPILHLTLGPLTLNLLGLVISIPNPVVVDITAVPGPGNLLGNLLCAIANLLNPPNALQALINALNQLLASL